MPDLLVGGQAAVQDDVLADGVVSVRELSRNTTQILRAIEQTRKPILITRHGKVVACLTPMSMRDLVDTILATEPGLVDRLAEAEKILAAGETVSALSLPDDA